MTGPSPRTTDPAALAVVSASARRFARGVVRAQISGGCCGTIRQHVVEQPLTGRQRASRDVWLSKGVSAFDATMLALQLGGRS